MGKLIVAVAIATATYSAAEDNILRKEVSSATKFSPIERLIIKNYSERNDLIFTPNRLPHNWECYRVLQQFQDPVPLAPVGMFSVIPNKNYCGYKASEAQDYLRWISKQFKNEKINKWQIPVDETQKHIVFWNLAIEANNDWDYLIDRRITLEKLMNHELFVELILSGGNK